MIKGYEDPLKENIFQVKAQLAKEYCREGELVVDVEATDELIGVHVLGLINTVFQANP